MTHNPSPNERTVRVAYVTKWATTRGIFVVTSGTAKGGYLKAAHGWSSLFVNARHWTESQEEAEHRYRLELDKAIAAALRKVAALRMRRSSDPVYIRTDPVAGDVT